MRHHFFLICFFILVAQIFWWYFAIVPKTSFRLPKPIQMILIGKTSLREVFQSKELLKEICFALGNETPIGVQFKTLSRRFYPRQKGRLSKDKTFAPVYYNLNDWAFGMLEYIPFNELPFKVEESWRNEVAKLMYQSQLKPIYGLENGSYENNKALIVKWKILLQRYLL